MRQALFAEFIGTAGLLSVVVGSGIMGERLADGNTAIALLANALATGFGLYVLISVFGPISGAHFNPAVSLVETVRGRLRPKVLPAYLIVQVTGAIAGVWLAHLMFDLPILQTSVHVRTGPGQFVSEIVATSGLILTIIGFTRHAPAQTGAAVGIFIAGAYWFTASTSFANPAVTTARALTDTFAGIRPVDVGPFLAAQLIGAAVALVVAALVGFNQGK
ncbi:MAG: aquaporin family protein [Betaproteobacteria bacterium]|jgi:glycerol uptake facilitator-like aquaporin|nr:MAG: aquaporin family protein [Betaproteobacteria bacterium]